MANCISCGQKAGLLARECKECEAQRVERISKENETEREARELARISLIRDEHLRIVEEVKAGYRCFLHKTEYISVDSQLTGASFDFGSYDDSSVRLSGLEGWRVVGIIPRTFGTLLKNQDGFNSVWAGGTGGNITGAYILMELELTPMNVDKLSDEIEEYLQETV